MASKSAYRGNEKGAEIEELLGDLEKLLERVKVLYEQYFMGMAKVAPMHQHTDLERRMRDVTQMNIRNTALRYRFATITQKFGSYNTYWKRTLREIESGRYLRNLSKIKRQAESYGAEIPAEILAAMPKRMQEQVKRDRELAARQAERRGMVPGEAAADDNYDFALEDEGVLGGATADDDGPAEIRDTVPRPERPEPLKPGRVAPGQAHRLDEDLGDFDVDAMFAAIGAEDTPAPKPAPRPAAPPPPRTAAPSGPPPPPPSRPRAPSRPPPLPPAATRPSGVRPVTPPPVAPARPAAPPRADTPGMSEADVRTLYAKYVKAREMVGAKVDGGTYDKLIKTIQAQAPKIMEQFGTQGVEFGVVIKDKQVILKAKPKP